MRLTRAFVDAPLAADTDIGLPPGPAAHLTRVLRMRAGDAIILFNGRGGEFEARITAVARQAVRVRIGAHRAVERESPLQITLLQAVARGERMDLVIQKATELGVMQIVPVTCDRGVVQLDAHSGERRAAHWLAVAVSACEQCGRNRLPSIAPIVPMEAACSAATGLRLLLDPDAVISLATAAADAGPALSTALAQGAAAEVSLLIGPEGGLSPPEQALAERSGFRPCRLGPRILRTETAALAAVSTLQAFAGDLRT
jgi:16S rRNA (uracil1498-N3)-methyltransferase